MTDISALEAYGGQLSEAAALAMAAAQTQSEIVNGDASTEVLTESGLVPTLAKQAVMAQDKVTAALEDVASGLSGAMSFTTTAKGLLATQPGELFGVLSPSNKKYVDIYENVAGAAVPTGKSYPSPEAVTEVSDRLESRIRTLSAPGFPVAEIDQFGRMSRYVDEAGHTYIKLHASVQIPPGNFDPTALSRMLPANYQFVSTGEYPFAFIDSPSGRLSELVLEKNGRFPKWVAKALVKRAGGVSSGFGGVALGEAYVDATQLANGATIPMDTAQASTSFGIAPLYVSGGLIVHDAVRDNNNAGYLEVALNKKASRIGAAYSFPVGAGGAITLVMPSSSWVSSPGGLPAGIHFVLNYNGSWNCSYLNLGESVYASGNVGNQADGVMRFVDVSVSGDDVTIHLPDGTTAKFTDARVSANITNLVIWELYEFAAQAIRPRFHALWGSSNGVHATLTDPRPMAGQVVNFLNTESI